MSRTKNLAGSSLLVLMFALLLLAMIPHRASAATMYTIPPGQTATINEWGVCRNVRNNNGAPVMVPTGSPSEWATGHGSFLGANPAPQNMGVTACTVPWWQMAANCPYYGHQQVATGRNYPGPATEFIQTWFAELYFQNYTNAQGAASFVFSCVDLNNGQVYIGTGQYGATGVPPDRSSGPPYVPASAASSPTALWNYGGDYSRYSGMIIDSFVSPGSPGDTIGVSFTDSSGPDVVAQQCSGGTCQVEWSVSHGGTQRVYRCTGNGPNVSCGYVTYTLPTTWDYYGAWYDFNGTSVTSGVSSGPPPNSAPELSWQGGPSLYNGNWDN